MNYTSDEQIQILIRHFNNYSATLFSFIETVVPSAIFQLYKPLVDKFIKDNSSKLMDKFIVTGFKYEDKIMSGDDNFFMETDNFDKISEAKDQTQDIFRFKKVWGSLDQANKDTIKEYMKLLCRIARKYFDLVCEKRLSQNQN